MEKSEIKIFQLQDGKTQIDVKLDKDTVWLNLNQMCELFERDKSVISRHINTALAEGELDRNSTVAKYATVQTEGKRQINREIDYFNLDMIISVGYRIKSQRGTQFRIWASKILKDYLVRGYALNQAILESQNEELQNLRKVVQIISNTLNYKVLDGNESTALLKVVTDYAYALSILDQYDYQTLKVSDTTPKDCYHLTIDEARRLLQNVKQFYGNSELFGNEKDNSFESSISTIYQTFGGVELYPSVEEKAANLLYFITKNHSFSDGNKRIAAFLFLFFLERNGILYNRLNEKRITDNALVAITLMIAVSKPDEKDTMIKVIVNLINKNN